MKFGVCSLKFNSTLQTQNLKLKKVFWKIFSVFLTAAVKTLFAPAAGFAAGLSFGTILASTIAGALAGFLFFYFFFDIIFNQFYKNRKKRLTKKQIRRARKIILFQRKYPVWLFVLVLPITSIPVMAVIIRKFYHHNKRIFVLSLIAVALYALIGCLIFSPVQKLKQQL